MNVEVGKFCVYSHSIDGKVFYVGMGTVHRITQRESRNDLWAGIVKASGKYDAEVISWHLTRNEAKRAEIAEIKRLKPRANIKGNQVSRFRRRGRINVFIGVELQREARIAAIGMGKTLGEYLVYLLRRKLKIQPKTKKEAQKR